MNMGGGEVKKKEKQVDTWKHMRILVFIYTFYIKYLPVNLIGKPPGKTKRLRINFLYLLEGCGHINHIHLFYQDNQNKIFVVFLGQYDDLDTTLRFL